MSSLLYELKAADLISPAYRDEQRFLHARPRGYGGKGDKWAPAVADLVRQFDASSVLDYGCGQGSLKTALRGLVSSVVRIDEYDPAVSGKDAAPEFADLVVCTDVLEHVEPPKLSTVLKHLDVLARKAIFLVVATRPSNKTLRDGRNAHLMVESPDWWGERLRAEGWELTVGPPSPLKKPSREFVGLVIR